MAHESALNLSLHKSYTQRDFSLDNDVSYLVVSWKWCSSFNAIMGRRGEFLYITSLETLVLNFMCTLTKPEGRQCSTFFIINKIYQILFLDCKQPLFIFMLRSILVQWSLTRDGMEMIRSNKLKIEWILFAWKLNPVTSDNWDPIILIKILWTFGRNP